MESSIMYFQRLAAAMLILVFGGFRTSFAQDQDGKQSSGSAPATVLKTTTRLVVVDVVATNGKGEPILDLSKQDFKLLENGKQQEIRVFDFHRPGQSPATAAKTAPKLPPNVFSNARPYKPSSVMNIILLDTLNTAVPRQTFAHDELLRFLEKFNPDGPVAIYVLSGELRLLQDFTDDPEVLKKAAEKLTSKGSSLLDNPAGGPPMVVPAIAGMPPEIEKAMRSSESESAAFTANQQVRITLAALSAIARSMASHPGRKNLIWISDGFPFYINPRSANESNLRSYKKQASEADNSLMDSQVAIYPVDTQTIQVTSFFDIGIGDVRNAGVTAQSAGSAVLSFMSQDFNQRLDVHSTMNDLAEETGGEAFYNKNSIELALRKSIADGSTYYTVGYYPQDKNWDGKFRKIEIRASRSGVKLRHRLGYYALEPANAQDEAQRTIALRQAMDVSSPVSSALLFKAVVLGPSEETKSKVVINFGIDPRAVSFEKTADGLQHASLECGVEVYSAKGKVKSEATSIHAALQPDAFAHVMKTFFPCQQILELPPGNYSLRLGVVDYRTGLLGTANGSVIVPASTASVSKSK